MTIRPLSAADYSQLLPMFQALHALHVKHRPDLYGETADALPLEEFQSHLSGHSDCSVVAEGEGGSLLGVCLTEWRDKPSDAPRWKSRKLVYVKALYVPPERRKSGIGRALMEDVGHRAQRLGADRVELQVVCMEENAFDFYQSVGYVPKAYSMIHLLNKKEEKNNDII